MWLICERDREIVAKENWRFKKYYFRFLQWRCLVTRPVEEISDSVVFLTAAFAVFAFGDVTGNFDFVAVGGVGVFSSATVN